MLVKFEHLNPYYSGAQGYLEMLGLELKIENLRRNLLQDFPED